MRPYRNGETLPVWGAWSEETPCTMLFLKDGACPVTEPMFYGRQSAPPHREARRACYLPAGCDWYDFWDGARYTGGQEVTVEVPLDRIPLFVRAGAILPMAKGLQYADQKPEGPLEIRVCRGADGAFELYDDAGDGYGYERGEYTVTPLRWDDARGQLTPSGNFDVHIIG